MTKIDSYLRTAIGFWENKLLEIQSKNPNKGLAKQYKGYVASFGTAVIHCGLLPAVFMFSRASENSQSEEDKPWILEGVFAILKEEDKSIKEENMLKYVIANESQALSTRVCNAAIALKLALRTFKLD